MTISEMKEVLDEYPADSLLEVGMPDVKFYARGSQLEALCPFHGDHKLGNFGYSLAKDCWRCFVCGKSGSGPYSLIMAHRNWSFAETVRYLYDRRSSCVGRITEAPPATLLQKSKKVRLVTPKPSPILVNDEFVFDPSPTAEDKSTVYSCFAAASPLSPSWTKHLQEIRGVSPLEIPYFFRFPSSKDEEFMSRFRKELEKRGAGNLYHRLLGIPGFFWNIKENRISFIGYSGALGILNHDEQGLVSSIEMRLPDSAVRSTRYIPFSSEGICLNHPDDYKYGANVGSVVDVVTPPFDNSSIQGVAVTEGKFKALHLSRMEFLALNIRGVGNWRSVLPVLENLENKGVNTSRVFIAFDADSRRNPAVAENSANFGKALLDEGYEVYYLTWPNNCGKGVDDVVNAGQRGKIRTVEGNRFLQTTLLPFIERAKKKKLAEAAGA